MDGKAWEMAARGAKPAAAAGPRTRPQRAPVPHPPAPGPAPPQAARAATLTDWLWQEPISAHPPAQSHTLQRAAPGEGAGGEGARPPQCPQATGHGQGGRLLRAASALPRNPQPPAKGG